MEDEALAREVIDKALFTSDGMLDERDRGPGGDAEPLVPAVLTRCIAFFGRMNSQPHGALLLRRESLDKLREAMAVFGDREEIDYEYMMHFIDGVYPQLKERSVDDAPSEPSDGATDKECSIGYVLAAFLALGIATEQELRQTPTEEALGPTFQAHQAWQGSDRSDYEWVDPRPTFPQGWKAADGRAPLARRPAISRRAYPPLSYTGLLPVRECVTLHEHSAGAMQILGIRSSARLVLPHVEHSLSRPVGRAGRRHWRGEGESASELIKYALPLQSGSVPDVRCTQGYACEVPADEVTDAFFQGFESKTLFLALVLDWGRYRRPRGAGRGGEDAAATVQFSQTSNLVVAVLRSDAGKGLPQLFVSEDLSGEAQSFAREAVLDNSLFSRWCAFALKTADLQIVPCKS